MRKLMVGSVMVTAVTGCGSEPAAIIDAPVSETGCSLYWKVTETAGTAVVEGGSLKLATPSLAGGVAVEVEQGGLTGLFIATFTLTAWTAGGSGAYVQLGVDDDGEPPPRNPYSAGIQTHPMVGVSAIAPAGGADAQPTTATEVTFRVERVKPDAKESLTTVTATTADATATASYTRHMIPPLRIWLRLGTSDGPLGPTSVEVTDFALTGSETGTAAADAFDCDSLLR